MTTIPPQPPTAPEPLTELRDELREFSAARGWREFHAPKNLAMALIVEAAELVEHFQWATAEESGAFGADKSTAKYAAIRDEVADVLIYLIELADVLDIDLIRAARDKIAKNAVKYPAPPATE